MSHLFLHDSLGAALLAAYGVGLINRERVEQGWVNLIPRASPNAVTRQMYADRFDAYRALYPALKPIMHKLQAV